ncbi:glycosyltransferase family 9 protein [Myroides sp. 1354]|uniref:glycosyltransferase family 9 protein n=1 Tax=unclassified Myroides TaxID=2642485 RepID=UPI0025765C7A|nr:MULTISPECIES: glycosyltransferase family 9 protein [unclassified Myroides]MDM1043727.1 glycosyltransferase family 9 protein [Myroides sp. R163-1]MDM1054223.1 glycosyltransferase family 9 protein [Myroides sp. 1354]MDM1067519.1 glycosyltransferase family 9 protein [Myroides sp. 1372]
MKGLKHIVIFRLSAMGDVAMTVPVIRALIEQHPNLRVTVVSRPFFKPFFKGIERVDFFAVDVKKKHKGFLGLIRLYQDIKRLKPNYFADFHNVLRAQVVRTLFKLSGIPTAALDKGRDAKKALTRAENKVFKPVQTMVENHVQTLAKLGFSVNLNNPIFPTVPPLAQELESFAKDQGKTWIGIAPFAQYDSKVYPLDLMQQVVDELAEQENNRIFLFGGGEKEIALLNQLKRDNDNVIVMAGKVKLEVEMNLIQHLDVMLSMDSGNAHIAAMLGVKVVTLWGATHPYAGFAPFNQPADYCITADREKYPLLPTSVYGNKKVEGYDEAMRTIEPSTVCKKVNKVAQKK